MKVKYLLFCFLFLLGINITTFSRSLVKETSVVYSRLKFTINNHDVIDFNKKISDILKSHTHEYHEWVPVDAPNPGAVHIYQLKKYPIRIITEKQSESNCVEFFFDKNPGFILHINGLTLNRGIKVSDVEKYFKSKKIKYHKLSVDNLIFINLSSSKSFFSTFIFSNGYFEGCSININKLRKYEKQNSGCLPWTTFKLWPTHSR